MCGHTITQQYFFQLFSLFFFLLPTSVHLIAINHSPVPVALQYKTNHVKVIKNVIIKWPENYDAIFRAMLLFFYTSILLLSEMRLQLFEINSELNEPTQPNYRYSKKIMYFSNVKYKRTAK